MAVKVLTGESGSSIRRWARYEGIDYEWAEIEHVWSYNAIDAVSLAVPLHPTQMIKKVYALIRAGRNVATMSDGPILVVQKMVGDGDLKPDDIELLYIYADGHALPCPIDANGDFDDGFPDSEMWSYRLRLLR